MSIFSKENKNKITSQTSLTENATGGYQGQPKMEDNTKKRLAAVVLIVGIGALVFSIWNISRLLKVPDILAGNNSGNSNQVSLLANTNTNEPVRLEELRSRDTDKDGLSDYDELYVYKTSPYIADSDSDGISDKIEIEQSTDPNCPEGSTCGRAATTNTNSNSNRNTNSSFDDLASNTNTVDINNLTTDQLRNLLRDSGVSETDLNQITDAQLMEMYYEVLTSSSANTNSNTNNAKSANANANKTNTNAAGTITYEQLKNLTPTEIRQFLVASGVDQTTLDAVDDATLQTVFLQAIADQQSGSQ